MPLKCRAARSSRTIGVAHCVLGVARVFIVNECETTRLACDPNILDAAEAAKLRTGQQQQQRLQQQQQLR